MDGKSSRNQEIHPLANFRDRAVPFGVSPVDNLKPPGSQSVNQVIHPFAAFHDPAQSFAGKVPEVAKSADVNPLWLRVIRSLTLDEASLQKISDELGMPPEAVRTRLVQELEAEIGKHSAPGA